MLSATVAPIASGAEALPLREALAWLSASGYRGVQLSATDPATRPRELDRSARRDLAATLARHELACSGLDFLIPSSHYIEPEHQQRAVDALFAAIELAANLRVHLAAVGGARGVGVPVVVQCPDEIDATLVAVIESAASREGVPVLQLGAGTSVAFPAVSSAGPSSSSSSSSSSSPSGSSSASKWVSNSASNCLSALGVAVDCAATLAAGANPASVLSSLGARLGGVRLVDLTRSGMRAPILEPGDSRLDALAVKVALSISGFHALPVADARQWLEPRAGLVKTLARWQALPH